MERLGGFWSAPGFSTEYLTLYLATDLRPATEGRLAPDEDEDLRLSRIPLRDAVAAVDSGVIEDAKSIAGILMLARRLEGRTAEARRSPAPVTFLLPTPMPHLAEGAAVGVAGWIHRRGHALRWVWASRVRPNRARLSPRPKWP